MNLISHKNYITFSRVNPRTETEREYDERVACMERKLIRVTEQRQHYKKQLDQVNKCIVGVEKQIAKNKDKVDKLQRNDGRFN